MKAKLIDIQKFVDDRGHFTNLPLNIPKVNFTAQRVYMCENFKPGTVRGFHYHMHECKLFICIKGAVKFILYPDIEKSLDIPNTDPEIFTLTDEIPKALYIPGNYANGWMSLTKDTLLLGMSSATINESINVDIRYNPELVKDLWEIKWR